MSDTVVITRPDDMHVHFRQGSRMLSVVAHTAHEFGRAIVMPNTTPYISTVEDARQYWERIAEAIPYGIHFKPLMTLYLQPSTSLETIRAARRCGFIHGMKYYPHGATTNSDGGAEKIQDLSLQLTVMQEVDMPLLLHGESANPNDDVFKRESIFYSEAFQWLISKFPKLRISCEHITTKEAVDMVERAGRNVRIGATITPQHLLENRNYLLGGMLRPHAFCKPILKREEDRQALLRVATSGDSRFFLGTDSAPHAQSGEAGKGKEVDCGCAGCFTAHAALPLYAEAFDSVGAIERLDDFASRFGADFYELPRNVGTTTLVKEAWRAEPSYQFGDADVVPFRQEVPLQWRVTT